MKRNERTPKPSLAQKPRGPGRPQIWQTPLLALRKTQFIPASNKSEAMTIYVCGGRMTPPIRVRVEKQPDGTYHCFKK